MLLMEPVPYFPMPRGSSAKVLGQSQSLRGTCPYLNIIVVFRAIVAAAKVDLQSPCCVEPRPIMRATEGTIQQLDAIKIRR